MSSQESVYRETEKSGQEGEVLIKGSSGVMGPRRKSKGSPRNWRKREGINFAPYFSRSVGSVGHLKDILLTPWF